MRCTAGMMEVIRRAIAYGDGIATITKRLPHSKPLPDLVFVNTRGKPWTQSGVSSAMRYAGATFAFRQLRAKAQTDSPENVLGHEGQLRERYTGRRRLMSVAWRDVLDSGIRRFPCAQVLGSGGPYRTRTYNQLIKSQLLYQLS